MGRQLIGSLEAWEFSDQPVFAFTDICWKEEGNIYHVRHPARKFDLDTLQGDLVPMSHVYAEASPDYLMAPDPPPGDSYIKRPNIINYDKTNPSFGMDTVFEIKAYEAVKANPHPSLAEYLGCVCEDSYVVGLCLKRYRSTLYQALKGSENLDYSAILKDIRDGASHLHSLGLVHNDINPSNIMIDEQNKGVLIDFDSCHPDGHEFPLGGKVGTHEWTRDSHVSEHENDYYSLEKLAEWLKEKVLIV